jgi:CPA2 family monovalent cation:H+ antiporter-2
VIRITRDARDARYGLLRGYFHGADDDTAEELQQARCQRDAARGRVVTAADDLVLQAGDTLVLSGLPEPLALAEEKLLRG